MFLWRNKAKLSFNYHQIPSLSVLLGTKVEHLQGNLSNHQQEECSQIWTMYCKNPKNSDTRKIVVITLKLDQYCFTTENYWSKRCRQNGKQCRPLSDCSSRSWVYTVCPDLSVQKLRNLTVGSKPGMYTMVRGQEVVSRGDYCKPKWLLRYYCRKPNCNTMTIARCYGNALQ